MAQTPKFIDITRTFIPIDPNAFPETLTIGGGEASPEERVPAMAYKGYNFMPTSYGYRSYFGLNSTLSTDAAPADVDDIFIFQNALLENVLIALTATGIWIKKGEAAGAWTHSVTYVAPAEGVTYLWTHVIIADKLYVYQQGRGSYYVITTHATAGVTVTEQTPNFLLMAYQIGIFRAAGRLAFWDTTDSVAWANLDDFLDFTPSLETLAGNATFADVQGRIINIISHGEGFMIYSTKSIMYVSQDVANLYQWKPKVLLPSTGIEYPRQACAASPDTLHFAYTNEGLKKIEKAQQETIVPEVTDFLRSSEFPIYLKVIEGRFLFMEMMDASFIVGKLQHGEVLIPPESYQFDGSSYTLADVVIPGVPEDVCPIIDGISHGDYTDAQPGGAGSPTNKPADAHPTSPSYSPEWTCYISNQGVKDPGNIEWVATPCPTLDLDGQDVLMCPSIPTLDKYTTTTANKTAVTGADAYTQGGWTMERFMAVQSAIWEAEERASASTIATILARAKQQQKNEAVTSCTATTLPLARSECSLGRFPSEYSSPSFGYNLCSFWLTRYITGAKDIKRVQTNSVACNIGGVETVPGELAVLAPTNSWPGGIIGPLDGPASAIAVAITALRNTLPEDVHVQVAYGGYSLSGGSPTPAASMTITVNATGYAINNGVQSTSLVGVASVSASIICPTGYLCSMVNGQPTCTPTANIEKVRIMSAFNEGTDAIIAPVPESGFCVITGWNYTKADGTAGYVSGGTCTSGNGTIKPPSKNTSPSGTSSLNHAPKDSTVVPIDPETGLVCGQGADGIIIDGEVITWPGSEVIIPASSFLFYLGSYAPLYPTIEGAFVYDLQLKKWGKMKAQYKLLVDYSPINSSASGIVAPSVFGILGGVLKLDGKVSLFDRSPLESYITYGKIGYYRLGNTSIEEVRVDFRTPSTGYVKVDTSLEGDKLTYGLTTFQNYLGATSVKLYGAWPGKWVNITISGVYDISYLEYRGFTQGRR